MDRGKNPDARKTPLSSIETKKGFWAGGLSPLPGWAFLFVLVSSGGSLQENIRKRKKSLQNGI